MTLTYAHLWQKALKGLPREMDWAYVDMMKKSSNEKAAEGY
jgi:hypothetical protein